jgi:hypothetical protein
VIKWGARSFIAKRSGTLPFVPFPNLEVRLQTDSGDETFVIADVIYRRREERFMVYAQAWDTFNETAFRNALDYMLCSRFDIPDYN